MTPVALLMYSEFVVPSLRFSTVLPDVISNSGEEDAMLFALRLRKLSDTGPPVNSMPYPIPCIQPQPVRNILALNVVTNDAGEFTENMLVASFTVALSAPGSVVEVNASVHINPVGPTALMLMLG